MHPSVKKLCEQYFRHIGQPFRLIDSWYFCDNQVDADACAALVLSKDKQATSPSLWWYQATGEPLPHIGDLNIITNWRGEAQCVIETTNVSIVPFNEISSDYAHLEGEGDKSLTYWRRVHWQYYQRELAGTPYTPSGTMPIVCEVFRVVLAASSNVG